MTLWAIRYNFNSAVHQFDRWTIRPTRSEAIAAHDERRTYPGHKYAAGRRKSKVLAVKVELTEANA